MMLCPPIENFIPGDRREIDPLAGNVEIPRIVQRVCVEMAVHIHEVPAELRGMYQNMRQDGALELDRALDPREVSQIVSSGVHFMVAHDQLFAAVKLSGNGEVALAEAEVAQMPHGVLVADDGISAPNQLGVVFLDRGTWAKRLRAGEGNDTPVAEMRGRDEEDFRHLYTRTSDIHTFNGCNPRKLCPYAAGCTHQA